jgi:hypothetical protein
MTCTGGAGQLQCDCGRLGNPALKGNLAKLCLPSFFSLFFLSFAQRILAPYLGLYVCRPSRPQLRTRNLGESQPYSYVDANRESYKKGLMALS